MKTAPDPKDLKGFKERLRRLIAEKFEGKHTRPARSAGVAASTVQSWMGKEGVNPNGFAAAKIARACGVSTDYLLTGQSSPTHGDQDAEGVLQLRRKDDPQSAETRELLDLARKVLESDDDLSKKALTESIRALSRPVKDDNPIKKRARRRSA